jgi:LmbE family N-acetylglucosaminyl deacetylase
LGVTYEVLFHGRESMMDTVDRVAVTSKFDEILSRRSWDEVFLPYPSHHQDHKVCYEQGMAALRQKPGVRIPPMIALYEYQFVQEVPSGGLWYHDISKWIDVKVKAFECYKSQTKLGPSPLNKNGIYALAQMRGMQGECRFAERFYIQQYRT